MNYLLDTQTLIWAGTSRNRLTPRVLQELIDPANTLFLSYVSIWELQIKADVGKSELDQPVKFFVIEQTQALNLNLLDVTTHHIFHLAETTFYQA